ncbi:MAG: A/G-specific adenine glycosylase [Leptospiraceae bacterium]|nr:A/G-specific adenine glycosylase [Leptospiraceae bacterium]MCK6380222.1 A/G-specific adenine glycosylase [Leptospiraceae bacterium]NUM41866.1 A/G-specific adenine glycosylase [Leptospiraceae bacterium]
MSKLEFTDKKKSLLEDSKKKLLLWFLKNKRNLPFRKNRNPYTVWVSEVMLQQTRMNTIFPLYQNFINRFPNIKILSETTEEEVLSFWKGLGYYSRALNLKKGAKYVIDHFSGEIPSELEKLIQIPGIGAYTARAISSIAFHKPYAVLDGNVKRVISRLFLFEEIVGTAKSEKKLQGFADEFLNTKFPGDHNEAMMELGSSICNKVPNCEICPLSSVCIARKYFKEKKIPIFQNKRKKIPIELHFLLLKKNEKALMVKYRNRRFFKTIFTPPFVIIGEKLPAEYRNEKWIEEIFLSKKRIEYPSFRSHSITHHNIKLKVSKIEYDMGYDNDCEVKWCKLNQLEQNFHSSIASKLMKIISD